MASGWACTSLACLLVCAPACRIPPPAAIDAELAESVPAEPRRLAGAPLDQVRASTAPQPLLTAWLPWLAPARAGPPVPVAYTGSDLLWAGRGDFRAAPRDAMLLTPQLAVSGPAALVRAAAAQHAAGRTAAPALLAQAEPVARQPVWA